MPSQIDQFVGFMLELDQLKNIQRKSKITDGSRRENSAEHSWHLAMAVWSFSEILAKDFDLLKLIQMALVHDIGEIHAGDTFIFSPDRANAADKERLSLQKTASHPGNPIGQLVEIWDEQELGISKEAQLLKVLDRLLPFLLNMQNQGGPWVEYSIKRQQVEDNWYFAKLIAPDIYSWVMQKIAQATEKGWLLQE